MSSFEILISTLTLLRGLQFTYNDVVEYKIIDLEVDQQEGSPLVLLRCILNLHIFLCWLVFHLPLWFMFFWFFLLFVFLFGIHKSLHHLLVDEPFNLEIINVRCLNTILCIHQTLYEQLIQFLNIIIHEVERLDIDYRILIILQEILIDRCETLRRSQLEYIFTLYFITIIILNLSFLFLFFILLFVLWIAIIIIIFIFILPVITRIRKILPFTLFMKVVLDEYLKVYYLLIKIHHIRFRWDWYGIV